MCVRHQAEPAWGAGARVSHRHQQLRRPDEDDEEDTYILIAKSVLCVRERRTSGYTLRSSEMRSRIGDTAVRDALRESGSGRVVIEYQ